MFNIPQQPDDGDIHYVTKGDLIRIGKTAFVELLPSGHVVKTPKMNPYSPSTEEENRQDMEREALVYQKVGRSPFIPGLIAWDPKSCTLTLEHYPNGDLENYIRKPDYDTRVDISIRRQWALQAAQSVATLHAKEVIHNDVSPRNFLLDEDLTLRICDFAGSSFPGETSSTCAPGARYESGRWGPDYEPTQADDIFALGSVIYLIMAGEEPYSDVDDEEVERRFGKNDFPLCDDLDCGTVIQDCWNGCFTTMEEVVQALEVE